MKIGIIGAGNVGGTVGRRWAARGPDVLFGVRHPDDDKTRRLVAAVGPRARAGTVAAAASFGEVVVLATPWPATESAVRAAGDLAGKAVIDCTNPLTPDVSGLEVGFGTSGAEQVARWAAGARVVKAFNTTGFKVM